MQYDTGQSGALHPAMAIPLLHRYCAAERHKCFSVDRKPPKLTFFFEGMILERESNILVIIIIVFYYAEAAQHTKKKET